MKTIKVNDTEVNCTHEVKVDDKNHQVTVHLTVTAEGKSLTHVMTVGSDDGKITDSYDQTAIQQDLDKFRQKHAQLLECKIRASKLASSLQ